LAKQLGNCHPAGSGPLADSLEYGGQTDLFRTAEFKSGQFEIQDISSQLVSLMCAPVAGEKWWDACAGEGGKTLHLSDLMQNKGMIWATDRAEWRLKSLQRRAARAGVFNYRARIWSGGARLPTKTRFDGVLVDAPCTGVGTWQRNPHARWTTGPDDVMELQALQRELLKHAAAGVRLNGKLIYAVCTLAQAETTAQAAWFQETCADFSPLELQNPLGTTATQIWLCPQELKGNGMFIAAWTKRY
jgi:16S rRNA (cytosine967-C5)-methyltransferase